MAVVWADYRIYVRLDSESRAFKRQGPGLVVVDMVLSEFKINLQPVNRGRVPGRCVCLFVGASGLGAQQRLFDVLRGHGQDLVW